LPPETFWLFPTTHGTHRTAGHRSASARTESGLLSLLVESFGCVIRRVPPWTVGTAQFPGKTCSFSSGPDGYRHPHLTVVQHYNLFSAHNRADPLGDNEHRGISGLFFKAFRRAISVLKSRADKLSSKIKFPVSWPAPGQWPTFASVRPKGSYHPGNKRLDNPVRFP